MINISVFSVSVSVETDEVAEERDGVLSVVMDTVEVVLGIVDVGEVELTDAAAAEASVVVDSVEATFSVMDVAEAELIAAEAVEASVAETKLA